LYDDVIDNIISFIPKKEKLTINDAINNIRKRTKPRICSYAGTSRTPYMELEINYNNMSTQMINNIKTEDPRLLRQFEDDATTCLLESNFHGFRYFCGDIEMVYSQTSEDFIRNTKNYKSLKVKY